LANVTGWLKAAEEELEVPPPTVHHNGKLYLSEEAWEEKWHLRDGEKNPGDGSGGRGGGRNGERGRGGHGNGGGRDSKGPPSTGPAKLGKNQCKKCFKFGHWGRECRLGHPRKEEAHATQEEEALMLKRATVGTNSAAPPASSQRAAVKVVHLREEKVFIQLGAKEERDAKVWICDTGATNHMSGSRAAFADLELTVCGTVRFGDDSVAEIEGCGSVLFRCKNGEHREFAGVYYIPRLTANIMSVGQLDEAGYDVHIKEGTMSIREPSGGLLTRVRRAVNRLYVLNIDIARPICLAARGEASAWRWHARFGHVNMPTLMKMSREELVRGLPIIEQVDQLCDACLAGKQRRTLFPQQGQW
jgi:hypothetical protein